MNSSQDPTTVLEAILRAEPVQDRGYTFIQDDGESKFYAFHDMIEWARRRAGELQSLGLSKGDRVALIIPDNDEFVVTFLGALMAGILPVPLYPPFALGKLNAYLSATASIIDSAGATVVVTTKRVQSILWPITDQAPTLKTLTTVEKIRTKGAIQFTPVEIVAEDPAFLQYTSGSTADPKGVVVTHRSLSANCLAIVRDGTQAHPYDDLGLSWLPLYHDMGLIGFVLAPLFVPLSVVLVPTLHFMKRPLSWMDLLHKHKATITFAPNFAYSLLSRRATDEHMKRWDLSRVRITGCGAEPISAEIMRTFLKHFGKAKLSETALVPCYGMAEATLALTFKELGTVWRSEVVDGPTFRTEGRAIPQDGAEDSLEFVSCGRAVSHHQVEIIDEEGGRLPERSVGEILFSGPSLTAGYFQAEKTTAQAYVDGWLHTGDLGYMADGQLFVTGRKKDLIIINGRNYVPQAIEWVVEEIPGIRRGNVVALSRPGPGGTEELVVVCEVRTEETAALRKAVVKRLNQELTLALGDLVFLQPGQLPKTTSGKLQRRKTLDRYVDGSLGSEGLRTQGQTGQLLQLTGHMMRGMVSRVRHTVRGKFSPSEK